jgi:hypothetical protein
MEALEQGLGVLPRTTSVIIDAEAVEMAQPWPSNAASSITPSSLTFRYTVIMSPQSGLLPRASRLAPSGWRRFRGCRP